MRRRLGFLGVFCCLPALTLAVAALAGPNAGGTVTLHWNAGIAYTSDPVWLQGGLTSCSQSVTQAPEAGTLPNPPDSERRIWFAYAAFPEGSSPRLKGLAFGITYTDFVSPTGIAIDWELAPPGATEIRTTNPAWPLPGSGTSVVFGTTMTEPVNEVYVFAGYGSLGQVFSLRTHPSSPSQFGDDAVPPRLDDIAGFGNLGFGVDGQRACPTAVGACCFPNGSCRLVGQSQCETEGGVYQGDDTSCTPNTCPQPEGACCFQDGSCQYLFAANCADLGGHWLGYESSCTPNPCEQPGACCYPDGSCIEALPSQCLTGDFRPGMVCDPNPCPQPPPRGACCYPDGTCQFVFEPACSTGDWHADIPCQPNPCPPPSGACCLADGSCQFLPEAECVNLGGLWLGYPSSCAPNPCPQAGACCAPNGSCTFTLQEQCSTGDFRPNVSCEPNPCPQPGACCYPNGVCESVFEIACTTGDWRPNVPCQPNPCPQPPSPCNPHPRTPGAQRSGTGTAPATDLADHTRRIDKGSYVGDNMRDVREGGESWSDACEITSLPFYDAGATCDNNDDIELPCAASAAPDVVYSFVPGAGVSVNVSLCGSAYDTALGIYDSDRNNLACNDDFCGLQSLIENVTMLAGETYYIVVDGYSTSCGSYDFAVTENIPCILDCPAGAQLEGEPPCGDNYHDNYNSGCEHGGWTLICPQQGATAVVCGKSGTYFLDGFSYRDTDWFMCLGAGGIMAATCRAEFPVQLILIYGTDCLNLQYDLVTAGPCEDAVLARDIPAGAEVWIWVGPSQFQNIPCESDYVLTVDGVLACDGPIGACCYPDGTCRRITQGLCRDVGGVYQGEETNCVPNPCPPPEGACCLEDGSCRILNEASCGDSGGHWLGFGTPCDPNPCPQPGACCREDGSCTFVLPDECGTADFRPGLPCDPNPCPQPGACCDTDGSCWFLPEVLCGTGDWRPDLSCQPNPCPQPNGACCYPDGHCEFVPYEECPTGNWQANVSCAPNPCVPGACCYVNGVCRFVSLGSCPTGDWRPGVPCDPNPCPQPPPQGACCYPNGSCSYIPESSCHTGDWRLGVPCSPNPCPHPPNPCNPVPHYRRGPIDAAGKQGDVGNHPQPVDKETYVGDGMGDTREGGESWADACLIPSLPYSDSGATCDNIDDITLPCAASAAPEVVYSYVPSSSGSINVSLCGSAYDCALAVYDGNQNNIACNDDYCGLQSEIDNIALWAGQTYYFVVDGFSTNCGSYVINVTENVGCIVECPAGAALEGEPPCQDNYVDRYNGGCNTSGWTVICPYQGSTAVLCAKSGTYLYNGLSYRDTDWYTAYGMGTIMTVTWRAAFPIQAIFIYGTNCDNLQYDLATGGPCQDVVLSRFVGDGIPVWLWAGPSQFNGIPCESDYVLTVDGLGFGPGCGSTPTVKTTWGAIKNRFR